MSLKLISDYCYDIEESVEINDGLLTIYMVGNINVILDWENFHIQVEDGLSGEVIIFADISSNAFLAEEIDLKDRSYVISQILTDILNFIDYTQETYL